MAANVSGLLSALVFKARQLKNLLMMKKEILQKIADCFDKEKSNKARNSMGVSESFYNPYYLTGKCFTTEELSQMSESELNNLIKLAEYALDAFC